MNIDRVHAAASILVLTVIAAAALKVSGGALRGHRAPTATALVPNLVLPVQAAEVTMVDVNADVDHIAHPREQYPRTGLGLVARRDGVIITAPETVAGSRLVHVRLADGRRFVGRVRIDSRVPVAVVRIDATDLITSVFSPERPDLVGASAATILPAANDTPRTHTGPLNVPIGVEIKQGAPVLDATGRVIGIGVGDTGGPRGDRATRLVPAEEIVDAVHRAISLDPPSSGSARGIGAGSPVKFGVLVCECNPANLVSYGLTGPKLGAIVASVFPSSPAERGGLWIGDVIVSMGGRRVQRAEDVARIIRDLKPGEDSRVVVDRFGSRMLIPVPAGGERSHQTLERKSPL